MARELWTIEFSLLRIYWVMPQDVVKLSASWKGKFSKSSNVETWGMIPHQPMWGLWRERNAQL